MPNFSTTYASVSETLHRQRSIAPNSAQFGTVLALERAPVLRNTGERTRTRTPGGKVERNGHFRRTRPAHSPAAQWRLCKWTIKIPQILDPIVSRTFFVRFHVSRAPQPTHSSKKYVPKRYKRCNLVLGRATTPPEVPTSRTTAPPHQPALGTLSYQLPYRVSTPLLAGTALLFAVPRPQSAGNAAASQESRRVHRSKHPYCLFYGTIQYSVQEHRPEATVLRKQPI